jgi:hypothetical protein
MPAAAEPRFIRLHPEDNVLTVATPITAGQTYQIDGSSFLAAKSIAVGFKVAARRIPISSKVIKYGAVIGSATRDIDAGEVVHTHNLKSDYLPTYLRGESEGRIG